KRRLPLAELVRMAELAPPSRDYLGALRPAAETSEIRIIAEIKRASPSRGVIRENIDVLALAAAYIAGGAAVISVLTDGKYFCGSLEDLSRVSSYGTVPTLRKDFVIDRYQIYEAVVAGASSALLIAGLVDVSELAELVALERSLGLEPQVEAHDENEVEQALRAGATIIGINNRDLRTFTVELATTERLRKLIPADRIVVSESGIHSAADVARLRAAGVQAIHVGESLMTSADPAHKLRELVGR
ncbi:MAG TPA: indole-3-glycerol phosphate synthase TrpC, partial [Chloroflexota bacterium]|nr:indole-3-glycerol phosphate synthase TrpC [Chloroflexota bacterium]